MKKVKVSFDTWIQLLGMLGVLGGLVFVGMEMRQTQQIAIASQVDARNQSQLARSNIWLEGQWELGHKITTTPKGRVELSLLVVCSWLIWSKCFYCRSATVLLPLFYNFHKFLRKIFRPYFCHLANPAKTFYNSLFLFPEVLFHKS